MPLSGGAQTGLIARVTTWLDAMPHPASVCEIGATHVAFARWGQRGGLEGGGIEPVEEGAIKASPVETNFAKAEAVQSAMQRLFERHAVKGQQIALLIPDPVVRVFILPFETLPRRADEAMPLLRWRLKKSVPFDVEDTVVSSMRQTARDGGLEVIAAVARRPIVREYEAAVEAAGGLPRVVLSSTLACLPLLNDSGSTMLVRSAGKNLTTVIVRGANLCVYRSTESVSDTAQSDVQGILDEVFPAVAYFQDNWGGELDRVLLAGFGEREATVINALEGEMHNSVLPLSGADAARGLTAEIHGLMNQGLDGLVGWMANRV